MTTRRVQVFGPAYLDRVLRVDRPLSGRAAGTPIDQSVEGACTFAPGGNLKLVDHAGFTLEIELPDGWPGPTGTIEIDRPIGSGRNDEKLARGLAWHDDLGGMGAGYAAALYGTLTSALGPETDAASQAIARRLAAHAIDHHAIVVPDHPADWTLLITSGEFGDKLPVGFRGCHQAVATESLGSLARAGPPCDLRVVAALANPQAAAVLSAPGARMRFFAPSVRNMVDRDFPMRTLAASIDMLSCNRREWETLEDREEVAWQVSILVVTDGPRGSTVRYTTPDGEPGSLTVPALPRARPPRDTNRAGEAYAATLIATLLREGWAASTGVVDDDLIRHAAVRASAAAALELDLLEFGFPTADEVDAALRAGCVA